MRSRMAAMIVVFAGLCCGCGSPSAPSSQTDALFELRITESPSCPAFAAATPGNFFKFGTVTIHVKGSFSTGTFPLVDDSLGVFGSQCTSDSRPTLRLDASTGAGTMSGRMDGGVWSPSSCIGSYVGAQGTVSGTRDATSASGVLSGKLVSGIFALNSAGFCTATDHMWSLKPAAQP